MHAYIALVIAIAAPALAAAAPDRSGHEREIDANNYNTVPYVLNYVLDSKRLAAHKNRAKLETKPRPDDSLASDNVVLESNVLKLTPPRRKAESKPEGDELVRRRRGYNLENVRVPAQYPYLPVANFNRFRRWG